MEYQAGTKIDLTYLNAPKQAIEPRRPSVAAKYLDGTKIRFLNMKSLIVMDVNEPPLALFVAHGI